MGVYDPDPIYSRNYLRPVIPQTRYWYPYRYYGWPGYGYLDRGLYRERVIIVQPKENTNYGKRPDRTGNTVTPQNKDYAQRGRRIN